MSSLIVSALWRQFVNSAFAKRRLRSWGLLVGGEFSGEGFLEDGLFEFGEGGEFLAVDGFETLGFSG